MVRDSATQAENEAIPTFLMKNPNSDSPYFFATFIFLKIKNKLIIKIIKY